MGFFGTRVFLVLLEALEICLGFDFAPIRYRRRMVSWCFFGFITLAGQLRNLSVFSLYPGVTAFKKKVSPQSVQHIIEKWLRKTQGNFPKLCSCMHLLHFGFKPCFILVPNVRFRIFFWIYKIFLHRNSSSQFACANPLIYSLEMQIFIQSLSRFHRENLKTAENTQLINDGTFKNTAKKDLPFNFPLFCLYNEKQFYTALKGTDILNNHS